MQLFDIDNIQVGDLFYTLNSDDQRHGTGIITEIERGENSGKPFPSKETIPTIGAEMAIHGITLIPIVCNGDVYTNILAIFAETESAQLMFMMKYGVAPRLLEKTI